MKNNIYQVKYGTADQFDVDTISAPSEKEAIEYCIQEQGISLLDVFETNEIPEYERDKHKVKIYEDNDLSKEPYYITFRKAHTDVNIETIASTNIDWL